jgi:hypothetical protein
VLTRARRARAPAGDQRVVDLDTDDFQHRAWRIEKQVAAGEAP